MAKIEKIVTGKVLGFYVAAPVKGGSEPLIRKIAVGEEVVACVSAKRKGTDAKNPRIAWVPIDNPTKIVKETQRGSLEYAIVDQTEPAAESDGMFYFVIQSTDLDKAQEAIEKLIGKNGITLAGTRGRGGALVPFVP